MELKERLTALRKEQGLTQDELAREVGVTRQAVSKWERGVISPSTVNLIALGRLYGVPLDELVNGEEAPEGHAEETETLEGAPPCKKPFLLKIMGAAVAAAFVLLVSAASVITIVSAIMKEPETPEDDIIWLEDLRVEDIDLSQVEDWTDSTTVIESDDETTTIFFDVTLEP